MTSAQNKEHIPTQQGNPNTEHQETWEPTEKARSMTEIIVSQFFQHRAAKISLIVLLCLTLMAVAAPLITGALGVDPETQNPRYRYQPLNTVVPISVAEQETLLENYLAQHQDFAEKFSEQIKSLNIIDTTDLSPEDIIYELNKKIHEELYEDMTSTEESSDTFDIFNKKIDTEIEDSSTEDTQSVTNSEESETNNSPDNQTEAQENDETNFANVTGDQDATSVAQEDSDKQEVKESATLQAIEQLNTPEAQQYLSLRKKFERHHLLGTDELGRDVLARLIYGARVSLSIGLFVCLAQGIIGLIIGSIAGYFGGIVDTILMRLCDFMLAIPSLPLMILLAGADLKKIEFLAYFLQGEKESYFKLLLILAITSWMGAARIVRAQILSLKQNEFILAAQTVGCSHLRIIGMHLMPNVIGQLLVQVTLGAGGAMLAETSLSYLGLGIQPPMPSWGNMLEKAIEIMRTAPFLVIAPGFLIFISVICINFIGDGMRDAVDPKAIRR